MKINELVNLMTQNKSKLLKAEQIQAFLKKELDIKEYLSIKRKKALIDNIINECILYENGVYKFDDTDKYIYFTMRTIETYTNLELSDDIEDDYDLLCEAKLLNSIIETFTGEYENVKVLLQMKCDYILSSNTIESQLGRFLDSLLDKVDSVVDVLSDKVSNFDMNQLQVNMEDINKLMEFVNSQKK